MDAVLPPTSRRGLHTLRGRQVDGRALAEIRALLGEEPRRRDLLIEHLHRIQDRFGHLSTAHLAALAHEMRLALAEVYEVATFYARFDVVDAGATPPPPITVRVCESLSCELSGATAIAERLDLGPSARVIRGPCLGRCEAAPAVEVNEHRVDRATPESVADAVRARRIGPRLPPYRPFDDYVRDGGYERLRACLLAPDRNAEAERILETIDRSGLRGLGGAGFPAGRKWRVVAAEPGPRLMVLNADEGEPGTFKDRHCLETDPHRVLEGMLIAAWVVEAGDAYVYLRDEYPEIRRLLEAELPKLAAAGLTRATRIHLRRGAGAYICGEESAMLESLEGKRGLPRHKPPFPAQVGLFGRPTLIQNVETMYWVRDILADDAAHWRSQGRHGRSGLRHYSLSGRVKRPGVYAAPAGITANELIAEYGGGMLDGHRFKAYLPGGASGGILPASLGDVPLDFDTLQPHGCFIGSAAVIVLSDRDAASDAARNLLRFFEDESCGQCTPCRNGTEKAVGLMAEGRWNAPLLRELAACMADASICGLGQAAPNPVLSVLKHFPEEVA